MAVAYSAVVLVAYVIGFGPLSGVTVKDGVRASYTFGDPNLAGNYLVMSLFMMVACQRPRAASHAGGWATCCWSWRSASPGRTAPC